MASLLPAHTLHELPTDLRVTHRVADQAARALSGYCHCTGVQAVPSTAARDWLPSAVPPEPDVAGPELNSCRTCSPASELPGSHPKPSAEGLTPPTVSTAHPCSTTRRGLNLFSAHDVSGTRRFYLYRQPGGVSVTVSPPQIPPPPTSGFVGVLISVPVALVIKLKREENVKGIWDLREKRHTTRTVVKGKGRIHTRLAAHRSVLSLCPRPCHGDWSLSLLCVQSAVSRLPPAFFC